MTSFPQLRVRTEYSFRTCYGPVKRVAERLAEIGCETAGIVDTRGTWGHVSWEKACEAVGISPMFGTEFEFRDNDDEERKRPRCWVLAEELAAFYRLSSHPPESPSDLADAKGVIRFAGAALTDPETFDYIDINPRSRRRTLKAVELSRRTGKPLVVTSDNDYPGEEDRLRFLAWDDSKKMTVQHIATEEELRESFWYLDDDIFRKAANNAREVAERLQGMKLARAPMIQVPGDFRALVEEGRDFRLSRGHIKEWTQEYQERMEKEIRLIEEKNFESYFIVVSDMVKWAKERMLVGPARGSSAGSLVCFLMQITEVDPIVHDLIFERFIDVTRTDLPDIDVDFNDKKRDQVFKYLSDKYGEDNVARIGNVNRLKPRSVIAHVGKKLGIPANATFQVVNVLLEYSSGDARYGKSLEDTFKSTQPGRQFMEKYPEAALMGELEDHASHTGVHAAGIIVSNVPVVEYCTVRDGVAQIDKRDADSLNLLKIDALGLRTLGVIEDTGKVTPQELYDLTLDDPEVLSVFNEGKFSGVFQFEGAAQRRVAAQVPVDDFEKIDHITALARPGPFGGGATLSYIRRNQGIEEITYRHPSMEQYLGDTLGLVLYQEQVMRITREVGRFPWEVITKVRKAMSGRMGKEYFDRLGVEFAAGAAHLGLSKEEADTIWGEICSFGAWGMNKSHTVSYAIISYWCAYMKRYFPVDYAAACLRNAKDDEQVIEMLREQEAEGIEYIPFDINLSDVNWKAVDGKLIGGFTNLVGVGPVKAARYVEKRNSGTLSIDDEIILDHLEVKYKDLRPAHTLWKDIYDNPEKYNINGVVKEFADLEDREEAVVICKLVRLDRRDENEAVRASRRGGKLKTGQTLFVDAFVVDDSVSKPSLMRIQPRMWDTFGEKFCDNSVPGKDWFLVRGVWLKGASMMIMRKIKCLTNPEMFK